MSRAIETHRVVTVTGAAGVGKTRLALAVAHDAAARFVHVRFVDALGATNRDEIFARIGAALGVTAPGDVAHAVNNAVTDATLVVLDGCERGADACRDVLDELAGAPMRFLITSRVALDAFDESVIRLAALGETASRALFADRAAATGVDTAPDDPHVAALLHRLAARRSRWSSPLAASPAPPRKRCCTRSPATKRPNRRTMRPPRIKPNPPTAPRWARCSPAQSVRSMPTKRSCSAPSPRSAAASRRPTPRR